MMSEWKKVKIGDVCDTVSQTFKRDFSEVVLINTSDVLEGQVLNHEKVPNEKLKGQFKKEFKKDDILYSEIRPKNKRFAYVDFDSEGYIASTKLMVLRSRQDIMYPPFLFQILKSDRIVNELQMLAETRSGTFPQITFNELANLEINIPPVKQQKKISKILGFFDRKIELNNKLNANLEDIGSALYIKFFITGYQDNWVKGTIMDLGSVVGGSTPSKAKEEYYCENGIPWITPKDLSNNKNKFIERGSVDITEQGLQKSSTKVMPSGTVLFSSRAPIGYIAIAKNEVTTNQGFKSVVPNEDIGTAYIYYFLKHNLNKIENMASGSTFKEVSGTVMKNIEATIPDKNTLKEFNMLCEPLFNQQEVLEEENERLEKLRDMLLPKLMSGVLDVSNFSIDQD